MGIFSQDEMTKPESEGGMLFSGGKDNDLPPPKWMQKQTTPNPVRPAPKFVAITEDQHKEALGLYLDYMFDAPHGTYCVQKWDNAFNEIILTLKQPIPKPEQW